MEAERAFSRLCPGEPFWPPPAADPDQDDDQAEMLKAAASTVQDNHGSGKDTKVGSAERSEGDAEGQTTGTSACDPENMVNDEGDDASGV